MKVIQQLASKCYSQPWSCKSLKGRRASDWLKLMDPFVITTIIIEIMKKSFHGKFLTLSQRTIRWLWLQINCIQLSLNQSEKKWLSQTQHIPLEWKEFKKALFHIHQMIIILKQKIQIYFSRGFDIINPWWIY